MHATTLTRMHVLPLIERFPPAAELLNKVTALCNNNWGTGTLTPEDVVLSLVLVLVLLVTLCLFAPSPGRRRRRRAPCALDKKEFRAFTLSSRTKISHDVFQFRFALQTPSTFLGLPVGQHITLKFTDSEGSEVQRSYTPVTADEPENVGFVSFVIKVYRPCERFPLGGKMSQHLESLQVGDSILMRGPKGELDYTGPGSFLVTHGYGSKAVTTAHSGVKRLGMICGGTGITPMLQVINAIFGNPDDKTEIWMIYANQTEEDILLRSTLESFPSDRFHLYYTLDRPPEGKGWKYGKGFITEEMCKANLPAPAQDTFVFNCGPPPMIKFAIEPNLTKVSRTTSRKHNPHPFTRKANLLT